MIKTKKKIKTIKGKKQERVQVGRIHPWNQVVDLNFFFDIKYHITLLPGGGRGGREGQGAQFFLFERSEDPRGKKGQRNQFFFLSEIRSPKPFF